MDLIVLGALGSLLGCSWDILSALGHSWGVSLLGPSCSWAFLGRFASWVFLEHLRKAGERWRQLGQPGESFFINIGVIESWELGKAAESRGKLEKAGEGWGKLGKAYES